MATNYWDGFKDVAGLSDNFSRQHTLRFRLREARREFEKLKAQAAESSSVDKQARWNAEEQDIEEHLDAAEEADRKKQAFETVLRHTMAAERKLIPFLPDERGAGAIADLRRDIGTYVPKERQAELEPLLSDARKALDEGTTDGKAWQQHLLAAKVQVDEIVLDGYRTSERLRDGIALLGWILLAINLIVLVSVTFMEPFTVDGTSGGSAVFIGFLFGMVGACLSGLMNFAVHRIAPGEFETSAATIVRPLIGGTSGVLGATLAATNILDFGGAPIAGLAIMAFILGFSERLVMGTVEKLGIYAEARLPAVKGT
jgi:hypothetical protein